VISYFNQDVGNENPEVERPLTPIEVINIAGIGCNGDGEMRTTLYSMTH